MKLVVRIYISFLLISIIGCRTNLVDKNQAGNMPPQDTIILRNSQVYPKNWPWKGLCINPGNINIQRDLYRIKQLGANFISVYMKPSYYCRNLKIEFSEGFEKSVEFADSVLDECKSQNISAMLYFSDISPKLKSGENDFWEDTTEINITLGRIKQIISHFKHRGDELQAYQFIGEPIQKVNGKNTIPNGYNDFFQTIYQFFREEDSMRYLIYAPGPGGSPKGYRNSVPIYDDPRVIYSVHYYLPHNYTHQGIKSRKNASSIYPGRINGKLWNHDMIDTSVQDVLRFSEKYKKLIIVGEYSTTYNAQGWENYMLDAISVFDKYKFSHLYNKWNGDPSWALVNNKSFEKDIPESRIKLLSRMWNKEN